MISAFENSDGNVVIVAINYSEEDQPIFLNVKSEEGLNFRPYITSDEVNDNLRPMPLVKSQERTVLPKRSIITFVQTSGATGIESSIRCKPLKVLAHSGGFKVLNEGVTEVEVWNMYGHLLKKQSVSVQGAEVELPKGAYLIRCRADDGGVFVGKIVV